MKKMYSSVLIIASIFTTTSFVYASTFSAQQPVTYSVKATDYNSGNIKIGTIKTSNNKWFYIQCKVIDQDQPAWQNDCQSIYFSFPYQRKGGGSNSSSTLLTTHCVLPGPTGPQTVPRIVTHSSPIFSDKAQTIPVEITPKAPKQKGQAVKISCQPIS